MTRDFDTDSSNQNSDNIRKLYDLACRMDERIKLVENTEEQLDKKLENQIERQIELIKKIAIIESHQSEVLKLHQEISQLDKRLSKIEIDHGNHSERWKTVGAFIIQLIWVILAAYLLTKLNLQSPAVP
jgi:hypothetical protein